MLGDELHNILYYADPQLILRWSFMFAEHTNYHEDSTGQRMQVVFLKENNSDEGPFYSSDCGFIKYLFLEKEVEEITKSLKRFMNLKAFL
jgi:hypothetical protein